MIDNSKLGVEETVAEILEALQQDLRFKARKDRELLFREVPGPSIQTLAQNLGKTGKQKLQQTLRDQNLMVTPEEIIKEIIQIFPQEVKDLPSDIRAVFLD